MREPLPAIAEKVRSGERLSREDGLDLFRTRDLHELGRLANLVRERKNGNRATYVRNMHLNYSNICMYECRFCGYSRRAGEEGAWEMDLDAVFAAAERAHAERLDELHIVGGVHPTLPWDYYVGMLRGLKERFPKVHLKAFTATEIDHFTRISGKPAEEVLGELRETGLGSLPGGGAEVFSDRVWELACGAKTRPERWLEIHRAWHLMGGRSTATMLYGHVETDEERVEHLLRLRTLQDETRGFTAFIPLCFQTDNNRLAHLPRPTARTDLAVHAAARLMLDNFDHLRAYWVMTGLKMAQILLSWGADDIDGTVLEERVVHMAGADSPPGVAEEELRGLICEAGREPVRRDTLYHPLSA
jgi:aminodeoxyfutalosine synthase